MIHFNFVQWLLKCTCYMYLVLIFMRKSSIWTEEQRNPPCYNDSFAWRCGSCRIRNKDIAWAYRRTPHSKARPVDSIGNKDFTWSYWDLQGFYTNKHTSWCTPHRLHSSLSSVPLSINAVLSNVSPYTCSIDYVVIPGLSTLISKYW